MSTVLLLEFELCFRFEATHEIHEFLDQFDSRFL